MIEASHTLRSLRRLGAAVLEATAESKLAYGLSANSYSYACMSACLAAEQALGVLREALVDLDESDDLRG